MLLFEVLLLSALAASSSAHFSPVDPKIEPQIRPDCFLDWPQTTFSDGIKLPISHGGYHCYLGKYPNPVEWLSWKDLWNTNREQVLSSNGGDTYIQHYVEEAILQTAAESDVDPRLVLVGVMQETKGKAGGKCQQRARCGIIRGGQGFDAKRPEESILEMLREGVGGVSHRAGLAQRLKSEDSPYSAMWRFHQDHDPAEGLVGEKRYMSEIANRLLGWDGRGRGFKDCGQQE